MIIKRFNGNNSIYKISMDKSNQQTLLDNGFNVLLVHNSQATLYPENASFDLSDDEKSFLCDLGEDSCIEISSSGRIECAFGIKNDNTLYITDKCNSNCIMCPMAEPVRRNGHNTPFEILKELVHYMPENMEHITITGGEPFIIGDSLFDLLSMLKHGQKAYSYLLLSNGRVFSNHEYCTKFAESVPESFLVGIPLHGHTAEIHDAISQAPGSFAQTTRGITNLLSTKSTSIEIRIVINRINAPYMTDIARFICKMFPGIDSVKFMGMEMLGNAIVNSEKVWIPYEDAFAQIKPAIDYLVQNSVDVAIYNFPLCFVAPSYWNICAHSITEYKIKYADACTNCKEKSACGGMFTGTDKYLSDQVKPIQ